MDTPLSARGLVAGYRQGKTARRVAGPADLSLEAGRLTLLLGANGAGKSTLLRTLSGVQPPIEGEVYAGGRPIATASPRSLARSLALVYTDRTLAGALTVRETVSLGRQPHTGFFGRLDADDRAIVDEAMATLAITPLADRYVATLSDGERQKTMIARALAQATPVILLDEPTAFLDVASRLDVMALLSRLARDKGKSILLSTHDTGEALSMADNAWLLKGDTTVTCGTVDSLIADGSLESLFSDRGITFDASARDFRLR